MMIKQLEYNGNRDMQKGCLVLSASCDSIQICNICSKQISNQDTIDIISNDISTLEIKVQNNIDKIHKTYPL